MRIENAKIVYVLGAGFSSVRGLPGIQNFTMSLRDAHPWLAAQGRSREVAAVEKVIAYRLQSAAAAYRVPIDLENIEELFSLADAGKDVLSKDIRIAIAATLDFCAADNPEPTTSFRLDKSTSIPHHWSKDPRDGASYRVPTYEFFLQAMLGRWCESDSKTAIVTFNYDCLVEHALSRLEVPFQYGFRPQRPGRTSGQPFLLKHSEGVPLLKLHGSVNWMRAGGRSGALEIADDYAAVLAAAGVPEIVPPTWRKLFGRELVDVWKVALDEFKSATRIVVLGFSIPETDLHFKYLLAAGLRENVSLREIVFVDRNPQWIETRARALFGNDLDRRPAIRVIGSTISQFISAGDLPSAIYSIDRPLSSAIQGLQHSRY